MKAYLAGSEMSGLFRIAETKMPTLWDTSPAKGKWSEGFAGWMKTWDPWAFCY